jgi:hypothetical protein
MSHETPHTESLTAVSNNDRSDESVVADAGTVWDEYHIVSDTDDWGIALLRDELHEGPSTPGKPGYIDEMSLVGMESYTPQLLTEDLCHPLHSDALDNLNAFLDDQAFETQQSGETWSLVPVDDHPAWALSSNASKSSYARTASSSPKLALSIISETPTLPYELQCPRCGKTFTGRYRRGTLHRHQRLKHCPTDNVEYPCAMCQKTYKRQDARLKHYRRCHPDFAGSALAKSRGKQLRTDMTKDSAASSLEQSVSQSGSGSQQFLVGSAKASSRIISDQSVGLQGSLYPGQISVAPDAWTDLDPYRAVEVINTHAKEVSNIESDLYPALVDPPFVIANAISESLEGWTDEFLPTDHTVSGPLSGHDIDDRGGSDDWIGTTLEYPWDYPTTDDTAEYAPNTMQHVPHPLPEAGIQVFDFPQPKEKNTEDHITSLRSLPWNFLDLRGSDEGFAIERSVSTLPRIEASVSSSYSGGSELSDSMMTVRPLPAGSDSPGVKKGRLHGSEGMNSVHDSRIECPSCDSTFLRSADLRRHMEKHREPAKYSCDMAGCGKDFYRLDKFRDHIRQAHRRTLGTTTEGGVEIEVDEEFEKEEDPPSFACQECGIVYPTLGQRNAHFNRKHNQRFACDQCDKAFSFKADLHRHETAVHNLEKKQAIACPHCSREYARKDNMLRHVKDCPDVPKASDKSPNTEPYRPIIEDGPIVKDPSLKA